MFTAALFTKGKVWKHPAWPSTDDRVKRTWCIYTMKYYSANVVPIYNEILLSHKNEYNSATFHSMNRLGGHYSRRNKSEKDRY